MKTPYKPQGATLPYIADDFWICFASPLLGGGRNILSLPRELLPAWLYLKLTLYLCMVLERLTARWFHKQARPLGPRVAHLPVSLPVSQIITDENMILMEIPLFPLPI